MINEDFDDEKYLNALLEANRTDVERFQRWFLKESVTEAEIIREAELLMEKVDLDKAGKFAKEKMKHIESTLKEHGVSVEKLKSVGKGMANKFKTYHKQGLKPKEASKKLMGDIVKVGRTEILKVKKKFDLAAAAEEGVKKVLISILFYIMIVVVNTATIVAMANLGIPPTLLLPILAVVVAPMVEEAAKNYFIQKNMPWIGTGVVFGIEAVTYIYSMMTLGLSLPGAIVMRAIALLMHFSTTAVQKYIISQNKIGPIEESKYLFAGWVAGVMIHASWNAVALIYNQDITRMLGG